MDIEPGSTHSSLSLGKQVFDDTDLANTVFIECTFSDVRFSATCLQDARFQSCRLIRCRFANSDLRETRFERCSFVDDAGHNGAQFAFSRLDQAHFDQCDLGFARFDRSELYGAAFENCNLRGAAFHKAAFSRNFGRNAVQWSGKFYNCRLELADLARLRMPGCDLRGSNMREAILFDADLEDADLRDCDLTQALVAGAKLARADLREAEICGLNLKELATMDGLMVSAGQQQPLLAAMGLDVHP